MGDRHTFLDHERGLRIHLSIRLSETGRRDEALAAIEEAATTYRRLADANPAAYLPNLAASLNNLSVDLGEAGRRDEALAAIEEAATIRRQLADANPSPSTHGWPRDGKANPRDVNP
ncbi:tetratricopeptide repeat protein [Micromonospora chersina]|uniref:tetratricopeptide repeat protein n=1 Tax=Micromonospora chersina TaxID=47854 RepID=UPI003717792D